MAVIEVGLVFAVLVGVVLHERALEGLSQRAIRVVGGLGLERTRYDRDHEDAQQRKEAARWQGACLGHPGWTQAAGFEREGAGVSLSALNR